MTTTDLDLPVVLPRGAECAECVEEFGDGLRHLRGVRDVTADVPRGLLHVSFDNQLLAYDDLTRDARRIGAAAHCAAHCPRDGHDQCECQLAVDPALIGYVALRIERSLDAARALVAALDREALARGGPVTRAMAARLLRDDDQQAP